MAKKLVLCDCGGSQVHDVAAIEAGAGVSCSRVYTALCTHQMEQAAQEISNDSVLVACQQERSVFEDLAAEIGREAPGFVDLRDRAGWSDGAGKAGAKMAALTAEALLPVRPARSVDVVSEGVCLIVGAGAVALPLAASLSEALSVTVLCTDAAEPGTRRDFDVVRGKLARVNGALGGFSVNIDALQLLEPSGRGDFSFSDPQDGGRSECDILIDVAGGSPFVSAPEKREGYLRADPRDPLAVERLAVQAAQLVGTFEKPLYVRLEESLCAHARAEQTGCSRCLDVCPTGAITSAGDHVAIDPMICAGCGSCAALCPSTAITCEDPDLPQIIQRMEVLGRVYSSQSDAAPRLLVHDETGAEMIRFAARFGRGLPDDVIPLELNVVSGFGHAEMLAGLALGFAGVSVLVGPKVERDALDRELRLADAIAGPGKVDILDVVDPDDMSNALYDAEKKEKNWETVLPLGNRRQVARLAAQALNPVADVPLDLPPGAPYGATLVDTAGCTLCLSCVSLCPSGALIDNPDMPQLRFQEDACLQCGICATICPEQAITLKPQLDLSDAALGQRVLNEEEPCACVECGALFGVKSTVERIMAQLAGKHPAFADGPAARMIQMCDNCRIQAQFHSKNNPFEGKARPRTRTTEDYYSDRKDH